MRKFLSKIDFTRLPIETSKMDTLWVLVVPWMRTAVPWYAILLAVMIQARGRKVKLLWDDLIFDDVSMELDGIAKYQNKIIEKALRYLEQSFEIVRVSNQKDCALTKIDENELSRLAKMNTIHKFRTSVSSPITTKYEDHWFSHQKASMRKIKGLFNLNRIDMILLPGGVYGNSGIYLHHLQKKTNTSTFDSGLNRAQICVNGITGYLPDVKVCLETDEFLNLDNSSMNLIKKYALEELESRKMGSDEFKTQKIAYKKFENYVHHDIIIPLNISWDLPALGKHRYFENDYDWVVETVGYILNETCATVAVRQHPHERYHNSGRDFSTRMREMFSKSDRFTMYSCDEEINTYRLIENSTIVLPYVSTIGVEAALFGKTVIVESDSYYSDSSFVQKANSKAEYFDKIKSSLDLPNKRTDEQYEEALKVYYISQKCTQESTAFTPNNVNYREWIQMEYEVLLKQESVAKIVESLATKTPLALLNHRIIIKKYNASRM